MNALMIVGGCWFLLAPAVGSEAVRLPSDLQGYALGAHAAAFDPAAAGFADGFELQLRSRFAPEDDGAGRFGLYAVAPLGGVVPLLGLDWVDLKALRHERLSLGLSLPVGDMVRVGAAYRRFHPLAAASESDGAWDLSLASQPASWLGISAGLTNLGDPKVRDVSLDRSLRAGVAIRPVVGASWLSFAADTSYRLQTQKFVHSRLLADIGQDGVHGQVVFEPKEQTVWLGLSVALLGTEVAAGMVPHHHALGDASEQGDTAFALTVRTAFRESAVELRERTVEVALDGSLLSAASGWLTGRSPISESALRLASLADDPSVGTVRLNLGHLTVGLGTIDELRSAIQTLRGAGKTVIAELTHADDKTYMVAAACDRIRMDPATTLEIDGFALKTHYLADTLGKVGVKVESVEVGRYKSGPDPLTRNAPRPEDREVETELLDQAYRTLVRAIADGRHLSPTKVRDLIDQGGFTASEALAAGLVDELSQPTAPGALPVGRIPGEPPEAFERPSTQWGAPPLIAVIPVAGTIAMGDGDNPLPGQTAVASHIVDALNDAVRDPQVRAIVMRIESGGGDVFASELIWRAARQAASQKPLIASMGDVAASGGYYVAAPAHLILAEPNTITGSIGIFTIKVDLSGLYALTGLHLEVYRAGALADWDRSDRPLSVEARTRLQHLMQSYYDLFVARVANGRKLPDERVRLLAEGRVYSGERALANGLVDGIGGLADAVREAALRAGLDPTGNWRVRVSRRPPSLGDMVEGITSARVGLPELVFDMMSRMSAYDGQPLALAPVSYEVVP